MAQLVNNLPTIWETWVQSLVWEDPQEEGMKPSPIFLPGKSHGERSLVECSPWGCKESDMTEKLHFHLAFVATWNSGFCLYDN